MSSVSDSTQIRIAVGVKQDLEKHQSTMRSHSKITHSDTISALLEYHVTSERQKVSAAKEAETEKKRRGLEDITLGESRKKFLIAHKEKYGFTDPNALIDTLLLYYEIIKDFQEKHELPNLDGMLKALFGLYEQTDMLNKETVKLLYHQQNC